MITIKISFKPFIICALILFIVTLALTSIVVSYYAIVNIKGVCIIDNGFEFSDFNEEIQLLGLARTELFYIKFTKIFTDHVSHYNVFAVTNKGAYILSPVSKILYIVKVRPEDINYDGIKVESWNDSFSLDNLYKPDVSITLLKFCEFFEKECAERYYSSLYNNCQHTSIKTIRSFVRDFTKPVVSGVELLLLMARETFNTLFLANKLQSNKSVLDHISNIITPVSKTKAITQRVNKSFKQFKNDTKRKMNKSIETFKNNTKNNINKAINIALNDL